MLPNKGKRALYIVAGTALVVFPLAYLAMEWLFRNGLKIADKVDPYIFGEDHNQPRSL